jgi:hypothetical protein
MRHFVDKVTIVDFLIMMALLLILAGLFGPRSSRLRNSARGTTTPAPAVLPAR